MILNRINPLEQQVSVVCLDLQGNKLGQYKSLSEAADKLGITYHNVSDCIHGRVLSCRKKYYFVATEYYNPDINYSYSLRLLKKKASRIDNDLNFTKRAK